MCFYNTLNKIAFLGALLLSSTYAEALRDDLEGPTPHTTTLSKAQSISSAPQDILTIVLRQASIDSRDEVSLSKKFRLVCKGWRNAVDNNTRATLLGLLKNKNVLLRHNDRFYRVERWRFPGTRLATDATREAIMSELESAITKKSPLTLRLIAAHLITNTPTADQLTLAVEPGNKKKSLSVITATVRKP